MKTEKNQLLKIIVQTFLAEKSFKLYLNISM